MSRNGGGTPGDPKTGRGWKSASGLALALLAGSNARGGDGDPPDLAPPAEMPAASKPGVKPPITSTPSRPNRAILAIPGLMTPVSRPTIPPPAEHPNPALDPGPGELSLEAPIEMRPRVEPPSTTNGRFAIPPTPGPRIVAARRAVARPLDLAAEADTQQDGDRPPARQASEAVRLPARCPTHGRPGRDGGPRPGDGRVAWRGVEPRVDSQAADRAAGPRGRRQSGAFGRGRGRGKAGHRPSRRGEAVPKAGRPQAARRDTRPQRPPVDDRRGRLIAKPTGPSHRVDFQTSRVQASRIRTCRFSSPSG